MIVINTEKNGYEEKDVIEESMTVKELIEELENYNGDEKVILSFDDGYSFGVLTSYNIEIQDDIKDEEDYISPYNAIKTLCEEDFYWHSISENKRYCAKCKTELKYSYLENEHYLIFCQKCGTKNIVEARSPFKALDIAGIENKCLNF